MLLCSLHRFNVHLCHYTLDRHTTFKFKSHMTCIPINKSSSLSIFIPTLHSVVMSHVSVEMENFNWKLDRIWAHSHNA